MNNAGITSPTRFLDVTGEEWDRIFAVNVRGSYNITRRVVPAVNAVAPGESGYITGVTYDVNGGSHIH